MKARFNLIERKYYKRTIQTFVRPDLTWNGILGGDTFAVYGEHRFGGDDYWKSFDSVVSSSDESHTTSYTGGFYFIWYNPNPLKVNSVTCANGYGAPWYAAVFYGSNDGENWEEIIYIPQNSNAGAYQVNSPDYYYYYKMLNPKKDTSIGWDKGGCNHDSSGYGGGISDIVINADEIVYLDTGTPQDYDYYIDFYSTNIMKKSEKYYAFI